jgi:hypothetical protein
MGTREILIGGLIFGVGMPVAIWLVSYWWDNDGG